MQEKEYGSIDYFRVFAAFLVMANHTSPLLSVHVMADFALTRILARLAVPFFFLATGYFLFPPNQERSFRYQNFFLKVGALYGLAILLYLPLNVYTGYLTREPGITRVLKDILFNGTFYHLWYFPAVMLGVGVVVFLLKHFKMRTALLTAALLYGAGLLGDSYYGIASQVGIMKGYYDVLFRVFDYTRNGLFFAPLFLLMGVWLSRSRLHSFKVNMAGFLISLFLLLTEGLLLSYYSQTRHDSMYVALVPCLYFLYQLLLFCPSPRHKNLATISLLIYILHPWGIVLVRGLGKITETQSLLIDNSLIYFIAVAFLSAAGAALSNTVLQKHTRGYHERGRAWTEVNLANLHHNFQQLNGILPPGCKLLAVVKANAYGHGDTRIASELQKVGVAAFAVASLAEGIRLRKSGIKKDILVLGYTYPRDAGKLARYRLTQTIVDYNYGVLLNQWGRKIKVHIKVDTGMHRLGEDFDHITEISNIFQLQNLIIDGMYTHLCVADSLKKEDQEYTVQQIQNFYATVKALKALGCHPPKLHIQSSYGLLNYPKLRCNYARVGIALYGALSNVEDQTKVKVALRPALSIKARVAMTKEIAAEQTVGYGRQFAAAGEMKIATVTIGYADGISRNLTGGYVLVKGKKAPIIGRICMDQLTVDISEIPHVSSGDVVTIVGQDGPERISMEEVARQAGTISNELFSRLGSRLGRIYINPGSGGRVDHGIILVGQQALRRDL